MSWWNPEYLIRRRVSIEAYSGDLPASQDITVPLDIVGFISQNKVLANYEDLEVLYQPDELSATPPSTPTLIVLSREVTETSVTFPLVETIINGEISYGEYWIYYGNHDLTNQPVRPVYTANPWPIEVPYNSNRLAYTRPSEHWVEGRSIAENAKATFNFTGRNVRLISDFDIDKGYGLIYVDDILVDTIDSFNPTPITDTAWSVVDLNDDLHKVQLIATHEKEPEATGYEVNIVRFEYAESYKSLDLGEEYYVNNWVAYVGGIS